MRRRKKIKEQRRKELRFNQSWIPPQHLPFFGSASPRKIPHWFGCRQEIPPARAPLLLWVLTWGVTSPYLPSLSAMLHSHTHNKQGATPCQSFSNGNIFATNAFVASRIDLLIHCCLIVRNAQLKDANGVNVVAGTWTGAMFPISIKIS